MCQRELSYARCFCVIACLSVVWVKVKPFLRGILALGWVRLFKKIPGQYGFAAASWSGFEVSVLASVLGGRYGVEVLRGDR